MRICPVSFKSKVELISSQNVTNEDIDAYADAKSIFKENGKDSERVHFKLERDGYGLKVCVTVIEEELKGRKGCSFFYNDCKITPNAFLSTYDGAQRPFNFKS